MSETPNLNPHERKVLKFLAENFAWGESGVFPFAPICKATRLDRKSVRRACRSLARKQLAEFYRGLWFEDGGPAGAGYSATKAGAELFPETA